MMLKRVMGYFLLAFLLAVQAHAASLVVCQQNPRDVVLEVQVDDKKVRLRIESPMGYSRLPQFDSPISSSNLGDMKYQAEQLKVLGDEFWVEFASEDCRYKIKSPAQESQLECSKSSQSSNPKVQFHTFTISNLTDRSFAGEWHSLRFRLGVSTEGKYGTDFFFISIPVSSGACFVSGSSQSSTVISQTTVDKQ